MKKIALLLLVVHFTLSAYMSVGMGGHLLKHGQTTNHAKQHSSFICSWMCAASSFVHAETNLLDQRTDPSFELPVFINQSSQRLSISAPIIRGPPSLFF